MLARSGGVLLLLSIPVVLLAVFCVYGCIWITKKVACCLKLCLKAKEVLIFNFILRVVQTMILPLSVSAGFGLHFEKNEDRNDDWSKFVIQAGLIASMWIHVLIGGYIDV
jgi:hypothetical protein